MTVSRDTLLEQLSDGDWHSGAQLGPSAYAQGIEAWIRLLRLSGHTIDERMRGEQVEYRLVPPKPAAD